MATKTARVIVITVVVLVTLFCFLLWHPLHVEFTGTQPAASSPVWRLQGYKVIPRDRTVSSMIFWAEVNHFLRPIYGLRGKIVFEEARSNGNEVYLLFRPSNVSDCVVLYRCR